MNERTQWFLLPDLYRTLNDPETLKRFAAAYMLRYYPGWEPIKIKHYRVLAERRGMDES
ncbi:hypothetical protein BBO01nite_50000 [Brevibacillus borstelensis]|nr:hypothetical protein BBO01nite_50000 [Brevibacillus borstelensis]